MVPQRVKDALTATGPHSSRSQVSSESNLFMLLWSLQVFLCRSEDGVQQIVCCIRSALPIFFCPSCRPHSEGHCANRLFAMNTPENQLETPIVNLSPFKECSHSECSLGPGRDPIPTVCPNLAFIEKQTNCKLQIGESFWAADFCDHRGLHAKASST